MPRPLRRLALDGSQQVATPVRGLSGLQRDIELWLRTHLGTPVTIVEFTATGNGSSAVSVFMTAEWESRNRVTSKEFVLRLPPASASLGLFPTYDLAGQFTVMTALAEAGLVPVPRVFAFERSSAALGVPFLIMDRVAGNIPSSNPSYAIQGWVVDASYAQRRRLQEATIEALAHIHATPDPINKFADLIPTSGMDALRAHVNSQRAYYDWTRRYDGIRVPAIERAFDWIDSHWPVRTGGTVLSWGDARIGNVIYRDFEPVAILDWDMAALGPRELDVAWFVLSHRVHQSTAEDMNLGGIPDFCLLDEVIEYYEAVANYEIRDFEFYLMYAALRLSIIRSQVTRRLIDLGHQGPPSVGDDYLGQPPILSKMLDQYC